MKCKFYSFFLLLLFFDQLYGQDCSSLAFTYTTSESRCIATGSITINVAGGSGNYNYKAIGPVSTPVTSSNIITGLGSGYYSVLVTDLNTGCTKQQDSININGLYAGTRPIPSVEPTVQISQKLCSVFTASLTGIYLLRITDKRTSKTEIRKLVFE